jgi:hypothetical protein
VNGFVFRLVFFYQTAQLGAFSRSDFRAFGDLVSGIGSLTLQIGYASNSGSTIVTSSVVINAGGAVFTLASFGKVTNLNISQASSQSLAAVLFMGKP